MSHPMWEHQNLVPLNSSATAEHTVERMERVLEHRAPLPIQVAHQETEIPADDDHCCDSKKNVTSPHTEPRPTQRLELHGSPRSLFHCVAHGSAAKRALWVIRAQRHRRAKAAEELNLHTDEKVRNELHHPKNFVSSSTAALAVAG